MVYVLDFKFEGLSYRWIRMYEEGPNGAQEAIRELRFLGHGEVEVTVSPVPDDTPWEELLNPPPTLHRVSFFPLKISLDKPLIPYNIQD